MHVGSEYITLACSDTSTIHTMTHAGDLVHSIKSSVRHLQLCHTGSDAVLVAVFWNNRLKLQNNGKWSRVLLGSNHIWPRDAAYIGGALFVLSAWDSDKHRIIKYVYK